MLLFRCPQYPQLPFYSISGGNTRAETWLTFCFIPVLEVTPHVQTLTCIPWDCVTESSPYKSVFCSSTNKFYQVHKNLPCYADAYYQQLIFKSSDFHLAIFSTVVRTWLFLALSTDPLTDTQTQKVETLYIWCYSYSAEATIKKANR